MKRLKDYKLIFGIGNEEFAQAVINKCEVGYVLVGGVEATGHAINGNAELVQTIALYEEVIHKVTH